MARAAEAEVREGGMESIQDGKNGGVGGMGRWNQRMERERDIWRGSVGGLIRPLV